MRGIHIQYQWYFGFLIVTITWTGWLSATQNSLAILDSGDSSSEPSSQTAQHSGGEPLILCIALGGQARVLHRLGM